jgi:DNA segregation ATPase FtsK/SpoIIIE, S-DNA-T family
MPPGRGLPESVAAACAIPPECPGLAVAGDTSGGWSRIRTLYSFVGARHR